MKMNYWLILAAALSSGFVAQDVLADEQPVLPGGTAPTESTNKAPAAPGKSARKKKPAAAVKKDAPEKKKAAEASSAKPEKDSSPATPGPAVAKQNNVNVRGQAAINSEVVAHLKKGDKVTILEEVTIKSPKTDEPSKWAKISLPASTPVWVNASFLDASKAVVPKKLNLRSGPGENYSVLGRIPKGTVVKEVETKGDWLKIEAPADTYAFVAAHLLTKEPATTAPVIIAANEPPKPPVPPVETKVAAVPPAPVATDPVPVVTTPPPAIVTPPPVVTAPPPPIEAAPVKGPVETAAVTPAKPAEEIFVKRVVTREGFVKRSVSIQAPTYFVLENINNGKTINYLYNSNTNMTLKDFQGKRIIVTGEELLDERWPNMPVISVETLETVVP